MYAIEEFKRTRQILFENEGIQSYSRIAITNRPVINPLSRKEQGKSSGHGPRRG